LLPRLEMNGFLSVLPANTRKPSYLSSKIQPGLLKGLAAGASIARSRRDHGSVNKPNVEWWERPVEKAQDRGDAQEHVAVAAALAGLPADHPARKAYASGADTIALTHVVGATSYPEYRS
jgi:hypothetical protein